MPSTSPAPVEVAEQQRPQEQALQLVPLHLTPQAPQQALHSKPPPHPSSLPAVQQGQPSHPDSRSGLAQPVQVLSSCIRSQQVWPKEPRLLQRSVIYSAYAVSGKTSWI